MVMESLHLRQELKEKVFGKTGNELVGPIIIEIFF